MDYNIKKNIDKIKRGENTFFLDPLEYKLTISKLKKSEYQVYNVYPDSDKKILYVDNVPDIILFKIISKVPLRHQDILGSLFSLNIDSSLFGDIIIDGDNYYMYVLPHIADYIENNLFMIGKNHISLERIDINYLNSYYKKYEAFNIIVPSLRADIIISRTIKTGRKEIIDKIKDKEIILNYSLLKSNSVILKEDDVFSVRKYGKYKFSKVVKSTHKNNYVIEILKYI